MPKNLKLKITGNRSSGKKGGEMRQQKTEMSPGR